ncbi:GPI mannosyltransferase 1 [Amphibalanus amphitrite]|uniref:GPI alpha-1,4-mannosyltransferase I, catalytic subunit n=1 Tax=Amphibalanus amphitrite TaxID=1232801 RepID=A0A6A4X6M3_AMPAM|nr:GPI mannosyltransferase 1-like [Amphibalanus amphitrite]XP_043227380.1 GPI mannosyltransferase 1-like [Amphibalanus amphitrite]XP_043227381.1 GPI mannosyltransferase 1-like [Amphibalanus amphitrite]XP_043227382.1 GPI mannosyltransferase 1-like [Amphibalanus amphitrite]XP_043227383.1 GPI mannosyltransferase 1-like [Amphibalanus amphitrite]KAF0311760.1 GPI mannosyltransferase 1 [Amphibalanus amphitrite]
MTTHHVLAAFLIRLAFIAYGEYQDSVMHVPYTDVDYHVFTDAAAYVARGHSPYRRATYRYTPLLAWLLVPTELCRTFGKLVFSALDVAVGALVYRLARLEGHSRRIAVSCAALWWYNPLPIAVCSRGNAESLVLCLLLYCLYLCRRRLLLLAGAALGLAVHVKIYPAVVAPALYWSLGEGSGVRRWLLPNAARLRLCGAAAVTFLSLTVGCWLIYGDEFLQETYLYHLTRRDVRHNFSVFFYALYLTEEWGHWSLGLVTFVPQLVLVLALAVRFHRPRHLLFCAFCQVYVFVTFNKVCTSQYFLWYLSLLPPVLPRLSCSYLEGGLMLGLWYFAQASWLLPAYLLEFEGRQVYRLVWAESAAFFCANVGILARLIRKYDAPTAAAVAEGGGRQPSERDQSRGKADGEPRSQTSRAKPQHQQQTVKHRNKRGGKVN